MAKDVTYKKDTSNNLLTPYNLQSMKHYTMEEINARIDEAERQIAEGLTIDSEDMFRELEEEFAREEQFELAEAV